jgi:ABC-type polysaccharide transport system permease subunit
MMGACTTLAWLATLPYRHMHIPFIVVQFIVAASWAVAGTEISHNRPATTLSTFDYIFHLISFVVQVVISFCSCLFAWDDGIRIKW